jgi:hypothetical protein
MKWKLRQSVIFYPLKISHSETTGDAMDDRQWTKIRGLKKRKRNKGQNTRDKRRGMWGKRTKDKGQEKGARDKGRHTGTRNKGNVKRQGRRDKWQGKREKRHGMREKGRETRDNIQEKWNSRLSKKGQDTRNLTQGWVTKDRIQGMRDKWWETRVMGDKGREMKDISRQSSGKGREIKDERQWMTLGTRDRQN